MSEYIYDAFISYRHSEHDKAVAKKLHTMLETYHIPAAVSAVTGKKKMGKVFRDEEELPLAVNLSENIEAALEASEWLIAICSPDFLQSRWCMKEIDHFISLGRQDHILLVLSRGTPETSFPEQLTKIATEDGFRYVEPIAANIASENSAESIKKLGIEKFRILAPMLGVGFDDLRRRARQRKIRIIAGVTAAVVAAAVGIGVYTGTQNRRKAELKVSELLEKAEAYRSENERIFAAQTLLEAQQLSSKAGKYRSKDIEDALRRTVYLEPFTQITGFSGQSIRVLDPVAAPDGSYILGIVNNNSIAKIDCRSGEILYEVSVSNSDIAGLAISADGTRFMAQTEEAKSVTVWNTADGKVVYTYNSKAGKAYQVANSFFLDNDTYLIQDFDKFYKVRSDGSETLIYTLGDYRVSYDPDDNFLTYVAGKPISSIITLHTDDYLGMCAAVSYDASKILIGGKDGSTGVVIIDTDGKLICELEDMPGIFSDTYVFTPDGEYVICTSYFNYFGAWDTTTGKRAYVYKVNAEYGLTDFSNVTFTPDSRIMSFIANYYICVISVKDAQLLYGGNLDQTNISPRVVFSNDGNILFIRNRDLMAIKTDTGKLLAGLPADFSSCYNSCVPVLSDNGLFVARNDGSAAILSMPSISSVTESKTYDGELAADINTGYNFSGGNLQSEHTISEGYKTSAADKDFTPRLYVSADGKYAVIIHADGVLEVFDEKDRGKVTKKISEYQTRVSAVSIAGDTLVCCHTNGKIMVYDIASGSVRKIWNTGNSASGIIMSPSGEYFMVMRSTGGAIDVYSCEKGLLFSMTDSAGFTDMAFSKDSSKAVGTTSAGYLIGEMFSDTQLLLERARLLAGK